MWFENNSRLNVLGKLVASFSQVVQCHTVLLYGINAFPILNYITELSINIFILTSQGFKMLYSVILIMTCDTVRAYVILGYWENLDFNFFWEAQYVDFFKHYNDICSLILVHYCDIAKGYSSMYHPRRPLCKNLLFSTNLKGVIIRSRPEYLALFK